MTTIELRRAKRGLFVAAALGSITEGAWWPAAVRAQPHGGAPLTFLRPSWRLDYRAEDATGRVIGHHDRQGWLRTHGPLTWAGVDYDFAAGKWLTGDFTLSRHGELVAGFSPDHRARQVTIETGNAAPIPAGLLLFGAWMTLLAWRDSTSSAT